MTYIGGRSRRNVAAFLGEKAADVLDVNTQVKLGIGNSLKFKWSA